MSKRRWVYLPEINPNTFLFFFSKGDSGISYSLRDYSEVGVIPVARYAQEYSYSDSEILEKATYAFDAPTHRTDDIGFWHAETIILNQRHLQPYSSVEQSSNSPSCAIELDEPRIHTGQLQQVLIGHELVPIKYPISEINQLIAHPTKGRKLGDLKRIFTSPISEDYVTWNVFRGLQNSPAEEWWSEFIRLVHVDNPDFELRYRLDDLPTLDMWRKCKTPTIYERWSRARMAHSDNPGWVIRSRNMRSVEGYSEIDLVISGRSYLIFTEAKLESDVSLNTTYDPARNQIIRNIDCVLEECKSRTPCLVLMVKDKRPDREYVRLLRTYQQNPPALAEALPHREPETVRRIAFNLAILLWKDVLALVQHLPHDVVAELMGRISN